MPVRAATTRTLSNDGWLAALKSGRAEALSALRERIRSGLAAALAGRSDVNEADLDDFTQDAVLRVLERLDSFRGDSRLTTWAMAVAVRLSLTELRRRRWTSPRVDALLDQFADPQPPVAAPGLRGELLAALQSAINEQLTPRQRQVLLAELEGIPQVSLAESLSTTPGAIYKLSHDARKKLKTALGRAGYDAAAVMEVLSDAN